MSPTMNAGKIFNFQSAQLNFKFPNITSVHPRSRLASHPKKLTTQPLKLKAHVPTLFLTNPPSTHLCLRNERSNGFSSRNPARTHSPPPKKVCEFFHPLSPTARRALADSPSRIQPTFPGRLGFLDPGGSIQGLSSSKQACMEVCVWGDGEIVFK